VAYGIVEEGLATKTFFMGPNGTLGHLGVFGHAFGVSWVWATELALFHAIFSIALPILFVYLAFPNSRNVRFLTPRGTRWVVVAYLATVGFMAVFFSPSAFPGPAIYAGTALSALAFAYLAWNLPGSLVARSTRPATLTSRGLFGLGVAYTFALFACAWVLPFLIPVPVLAIVAMVAVTVGVGYLARRGFGSTPTPARLTAFAAGLVVFLLVFSVFAELFGDLGVLVVSGLLVAFLLLLYQDRCREESEPLVPGPSPVPPPGSYAG
jgi:hypothetical protein